MIERLVHKRLYIAHLVLRQAEMENGQAPLDPVLYRVVARRLREAVAGFPEHELAGRFGVMQPLVDEVLETRHFDDRGTLRGPLATECRRSAAALLKSLTRRRKGERARGAVAAPVAATPAEPAAGRTPATLTAPQRRPRADAKLRGGEAVRGRAGD